MEIARLTAPMSGSPFREKCLQLQADLKSRFEQIVQPFVQFPDKKSGRSGRWPLKEIQALALKGEFLLYSDDSIFRTMCATEAGLPEGICAMDVLCALEQEGRLTAVEVGQKVAQLAAWRVALAIDTKFQRAVFPVTLCSAKSVDAGIALIRGDEQCMAVMNAVWDGEPDYMILQQRAGSLLRDLVGDEHVSTAEISAAMGVWYFKAKLREDAPFPSTALLSFLTFQTAGSGPSLNASAAKRLWNVYGALVELSHGAQMDEEKERESIAMLGAVGAQIDFASPQGAQSAKEWLNLKLTEGTSDHDCFHRGYAQESERLAKRAMQ